MATNENVLIKTGQGVLHKPGVYGIYYIRDLVDEVMIYVGGTLKSVADCYNRHDSCIKNGSYIGTNKEIINELHEAGNKLYFKVITYCNVEDVRIIETEYINIYTDTICNSDKVGKARSSKPTEEETKRRSKANSGERNPRAEKSDEEIAIIRDYINSGLYRDKYIAKLFNISLSYVSALRHEKRRKKEDVSSPKATSATDTRQSI